MRIMLRVALMVAMAMALASGIPAAGPTSRPNPRLAAMKPHSWLRIGQAPPSPKGIMAYSGGVLDTKHNVFLIFGGGHADYWGNEVCAFDVAALTWKKMYEPDARERYTNDNIDNSRGKLRDSDKPYTRHSYQMLAFVPTAGKMFIWSGCGPGWGSIAPTCPSPRDAWYYDYAANNWQALATSGPGGYGGGTCYDSKRDVLWALPGQSWPPLWKFHVKTGAWSKHKMKPDTSSGAHTNLAYDAKRDLILAGVGGDGKRSYLINPRTFEVEKLDTTSFRPGGSGGLVMLPDQDVGLSLTSSGKLGVFDFATKKWYGLDEPEGGPKMMGYAVYGRLAWSPIDKVVLFVGPSGTWAYKPPARFTFEGGAAKAAD